MRNCSTSEKAIKNIKKMVKFPNPKKSFTFNFFELEQAKIPRRVKSKTNKQPFSNILSA